MPSTEELYLMLGRVDGKVDTILTHNSQVFDILHDHDRRLTTMEKSGARSLGVVLGVSSLASLIVSVAIWVLEVADVIDLWPVINP